MSMSRKEIQPYMAKGPQKLITTNQILAIHQLLANLYGGVTDLRSPEMVKMLDELANEINACRNRAEIIKAAVPYLCADFVAMMIMFFFPAVALWLPSVVK